MPIVTSRCVVYSPLTISVSPRVPTALPLQYTYVLFLITEHVGNADFFKVLFQLDYQAILTPLVIGIDNPVARDVMLS